MIEVIIRAIMVILRALGLIPPEPSAPPTPPTPPVTPPTLPTDRMLFPPGMIQTLMPNGAAAIPWSQVARWEPLFTRAVAEQGNPFGPLLLALFAVVESRGNQYSTGQMTGTREQVVAGRGDARSKGLLQIRLDLHAANLPDADGYTPEGNIRLGAKLLAMWITGEGSWEAALRNKWHPGTDPASGVTREEYIRFIREAIAEVKAYWATFHQPPPTTPATPPRVNPYATPVIYTLSADYARFGLSKAEADTIIGNRFTNRVDSAGNQGRPTTMVNHIQAGTTRSSLDWWANGAGVQASSTVMAQQDGSILRVIPEQHGPWTNGEVCRPTAKSAGLRARGGNVNIWCLTLEAEGDSDIPYTEPQFMAILWQFADWLIRYDLNLADLLSHATIDQCNRPSCPGEAHQLAVLERLTADGFA